MQGHDILNKWDIPSKISTNCHKRLVPKFVVWHDQRGRFVRMFLRDRLDCLVPSACGSFTQLFFQSLLSHTLCSRFEGFSTAKNLSNLCCNKLHHVSTYAFCRWDDIFTQKWNCSSPNILSKCTESPSPLFSNPSII